MNRITLTYETEAGETGQAHFDAPEDALLQLLALAASSGPDDSPAGKAAWLISRAIGHLDRHLSTATGPAAKSLFGGG